MTHTSIRIEKVNILGQDVSIVVDGRGTIWFYGNKIAKIMQYKCCPRTLYKKVSPSNKLQLKGAYAAAICGAGSVGMVSIQGVEQLAKPEMPAKARVLATCRTIAANTEKEPGMLF